MKVIFLTDVRGQGKKDEIKEVSDGYARNYLIPRKLAAQASADALNAIKLKEKARLKQLEKDKALALELSKKLESLVVKVPARGGDGGKLFGSVTSKEISDALMAQHGISIDKNKIVQPEPIKAFGSYEIKCKLGFEQTGTLNVLVIQEK
ncbi:MAG: 50S ribosomal protein L9 [Oscillospiraceae bacterium]|jgi:large subunit ribosomal protein L9|nr:50S ribosomal protein L9 [Oscillospiraceae bacterium]